jgi:3-oxoacyl-[acyl-carrier protein] reductase
MAQSVAIVTGGSRGIGRAISRALAASGHAVVLSYRERAAEADAVVREIQAVRGEACAVRAEAASRDDATGLVRSATDRYGRVDVLVNNAGMFANARVADLDPREWQRILDVNLAGPLHLIQAVLPDMRARKRGCIINLSSNVTARLPAGFGAYAVSKAGLEALTRILAKEEGAHGIRVNAVAPGPIRTEMLASTLDLMGRERAQAFLASFVLGRAGEPDEIAAAVNFLASDAASYITGQVLYVNGGGASS